MANFSRKNVSEEFQKFHYDEQAFDWLEKAQELGYDPETGIRYIGPNAFQKSKRIPDYFHYFGTVGEAKSFMMSSVESKCFFIFLHSNNKELQAGVKNGDLTTIRALRSESSQWFFEGESLKYLSLEDLIQKEWIDKEFVGV